MITDLINLKTMPNQELVRLYNEHSQNKVLRFSDRATAIRRCTQVLLEVASRPPELIKVDRPNMKDSLKLDRTIRCVNKNGRELGVWKNAHQMWKDNPYLLTSSQQDRLTKQLYAAAKQGVRLVVTINDRQFSLVNVPKVSP